MNVEKLAICGGEPVYPDGLPAPLWPPVTEKTGQRLMEVYKSRQWSFNSPAEQKLQSAFAKAHDAKHGIFMSNGTTSLEAALATCGIGAGDEVLIPAITWPATAMAAVYVGAIPVFVDIEPTTLCMDPEKAAVAVTDRTKAIIPVHLYGSMADLEAIQAVCDEHDLVMIEDCAHMHGGKWNGKGAGSWGKVGSFSFQQSKTVASGEGGLCITDDDELAEQIYRYKHIGYNSGTAQGAAQEAARQMPELICHNYRGTAFETTILLEQTELLAKRMETYGKNAARLTEVIEKLDGVRVQSPGRLATTQGYYMFAMIFDEGPLADVPLRNILEASAAEGFPLAGTYGPVYKHTMFNLPADKYRIDGDSCPIAEGLGSQRVAIFVHRWLGSDEETIDVIGKIIAKIAANVDDLKNYKSKS